MGFKHPPWVLLPGVSMQEPCCSSHHLQIIHLAARTCKMCYVFSWCFLRKIIFIKLLLLKNNKKVTLCSLLLALSALLSSQLQLGGKNKTLLGRFSPLVLAVISGDFSSALWGAPWRLLQRYWYVTINTKATGPAQTMCNICAGDVWTHITKYIFFG